MVIILKARQSCPATFTGAGLQWYRADGLPGETTNNTKLNTMKTFAHLEFTPHPIFAGGLQAVIDFPNGYGLSVVKFAGSFGYGENLWEIAVLIRGDLARHDVIGCQTEEDITAVMKKLQALPTLAPAEF